MTEPVTGREFSQTISSAPYREQLVAIRDLLAADADDVTWEKHKAECRCICGMADTRARVAILKQLQVVLDAIEALPAEEGTSRLDSIAAARSDELAGRRGRAGRIAGTAS